MTPKNKALKMMKIIVIGLLYHLLLQASSEPMAKVQLCNDFFVKDFTATVNQIDLSEHKENIGGYRAEIRYGPRGKFYMTKVIPIASIEIEDVAAKSPMKIKIRIKFGEKTVQQNKMKETENSYLFLNIDIVTIVRMEVKRDKFYYYVQDCEVYLKDHETDIKEDIDMDTAKVRRLLKSKLCGIARQFAENLNENWNDHLIIDPSGGVNLIFKSSSRISIDCLLLQFNLAVNKSEVTSAQKHDVLKGNRISLVKDYIGAMFTPDVYITKVNKILEEKNLQLSPEELNLLNSDVFETDPTSLTVTIIEQKLNVENETMTTMMKLQGFSSKSEKSAFEVIFEPKMKVEYLLTNGKLKLHFLSSGHEVIHNYKSQIGNSGDLDLVNLQKLITSINHETILPAMNVVSTDLPTRVGIPFGNVASQVTVKSESLEFAL